MVGVLVLNASYEVLTEVSWQRAVTMVIAGEAVIKESVEGREVRSPSMSIPFPKEIVLARYVYVKYTKRISGTDGCTRKGVLERDKHTCIYCGRRGTTIDHIQPKSRGGRDTWENLAACCPECNSIKADCTPEEAGMRLRWTPRKPDFQATRQKQVWRGLATAAA